MRGGESVLFIINPSLFAHRPLDPLSIVLEIPRRCINNPFLVIQIPCSSPPVNPPFVQIPVRFLGLFESRIFPSVCLVNQERFSSTNRCALLRQDGRHCSLKFQLWNQKTERKIKKMAARRKGVAPERGGQSTISIANRSSGEPFDRFDPRTGYYTIKQSNTKFEQSSLIRRINGCD